MADILATYPEIATHIDALCGGNPWGISGASALVCDDDAFYLEVTHPKHWRRLPDGRMQAGLGAIGGSIEDNEGALACLYREMAEEVDADVQVESAEETHLVYEERVAEIVQAPPRDLPLPVLCTISANLYRRQHHPQWQTLVIVTFLARTGAPPAPRDLYGLAGVPRAYLAEVLAPDTIPLERLRAVPGVRIEAQAALPPDLVLAPVWTIRSLQLLLREGRQPVAG